MPASCLPVQLGCGFLMGSKVQPHSSPSKLCPHDSLRLVFLIVEFPSRNGQMTSSDSRIVWGNLWWIVGLVIVFIE